MLDVSTSSSQGIYRTYMIDQTRSRLVRVSYADVWGTVDLVSPALQPADQKMPFWGRLS